MLKRKIKQCKFYYLVNHERKEEMKKVLYLDFKQVDESEGKIFSASETFLPTNEVRTFPKLTAKNLLDQELEFPKTFKNQPASVVVLTLVAFSKVIISFHN